MTSTTTTRIGWAKFHDGIEFEPDGPHDDPHSELEVIWEGKPVGRLIHSSGWDEWTAFSPDGVVVGAEMLRYDAASFLVPGVDGKA